MSFSFCWSNWGVLAAGFSSPFAGPGRPCEGGSSLVESGFIIFGGKADHVTAKKRLQKLCITTLIRSSKYKISLHPWRLCWHEELILLECGDLVGVWNVWDFSPEGDLPLGLRAGWSHLHVAGAVSAVQCGGTWRRGARWRLSLLRKSKAECTEPTAVNTPKETWGVSCPEPGCQPYRLHLILSG